jgi:hypothetical protein
VILVISISSKKFQKKIDRKKLLIMTAIVKHMPNPEKFKSGSISSSEVCSICCKEKVKGFYLSLEYLSQVV